MGCGASAGCTRASEAYQIRVVAANSERGKPGEECIPKPIKYHFFSRDSVSSTHTVANPEDVPTPANEVFAAHLGDPAMRQLTAGLLATCWRIADAVQVKSSTAEAAAAHGNRRLPARAVAENLLWEFATSTASVYEAASTNKPELVRMHPNARFVLSWDALGGSTTEGDNTSSTGTVIGVWDKKTGLVGATGNDQLLSLVVHYGARCVAFVTLDDGVYEFFRGDNRSWHCSRDRFEVRVQQTSQIFSLANPSAAEEIEGYGSLIEHYLGQRADAVNSAALVPSVCHQLVEGEGVYASPTCAAAPSELFLALQAAPLGRLIECAGGATSDGAGGRSVLDLRIEAVDHRTALAIGSAAEVDRFNEMVLGVNPAGA